MLTPKENKFIELQRKKRKHYLIIFFVFLIFMVVMYPVTVNIAFDFVKQALNINLPHEARKGMFEGFLMMMVTGGLIGIFLGLVLGFYIMDTRWLKIVDKLVPLVKEQMES